MLNPRARAAPVPSAPVRTLPEGFDVSRLAPSLAQGWGIVPTEADYLAVGFGSYHWGVSGDDGRRHFVTVDDLDHKPWFGRTREAAHVGLAKAFDTARDLIGDCALEFVVAPLPTTQGTAIHRVGERHTVAVFPFVEGRSGDFGDELTPTDRAELLHLLGRLHRASPQAATPRVDVPFPERGDLELALQEVDRTWNGGPYSEPARAWLVDRSATLRRQLREFDRLHGQLTHDDLVITHGEPHPGNLIRGDDHLVLIDWDTVALAPPERDLWMLSGPDGQALTEYVDATGHEVDPAALALDRLAWSLGDVGSFISLFRAGHEHTEDTEQAWDSLTGST